MAGNLIKEEDKVEVDYLQYGKQAQRLRPTVYRCEEGFCCLTGPDPETGIFGCGNSADAAINNWLLALDKRFEKLHGGAAKTNIKTNKTERVAEPWEPFEIEVTIEGSTEKILVIPDREEPIYALFDDHTAIGTVWQELKEDKQVWCAEGMVARELLDQVGQQIEENKKWSAEERP